MDQGLLTNKDLVVICLLLPKLWKIPNSARYRLSVLLIWFSVGFSRFSKDQEMQITVFKYNCHFTACFPTGKKIVRCWVPVVPISMHSMHIQLHGTYHYPLCRRALSMARWQQNPQCHSVFSGCAGRTFEMEQGHGHSALYLWKCCTGKCSGLTLSISLKGVLIWIWSDKTQEGICRSYDSLSRLPGWYLSHSGALAEISIICNDI